MITSCLLTNPQMFLCHKVVNESSIPFATEKPRKLDPRSNVEQLTVTPKREALPNFCGNIATIIVADRKLQVLYYS